MSGLLYHNWHFFNLLSTTDCKQQNILLNNLNDTQVDLLSEIFHNLGHVITFEHDEHDIFKKYLKTIELLAQVSRSRKLRKGDIKRHMKTVLKILDLVSEDILQAGEYFRSNRMNDAC